MRLGKNPDYKRNKIRLVLTVLIKCVDAPAHTMRQACSKLSKHVISGP